MRTRVIANPASDQEFQRRADELAREVRTPADLERRLRAHYPNARVSEGIANGSSVRWYAYRDGHWVANGDAAFAEHA